jgi:hypothetical protein
MLTVAKKLENSDSGKNWKQPTTHMKTFDQTACKLIEVGLRSDEYGTISRIYRRNLSLMMLSTCQSLELNEMLLDPEFVDEMWTAASSTSDVSEYDNIRAIHGIFKGRSHLQTRLAFVFWRKRPFTYKVVSDSSYGSKPNGRRRLLSQEEEIAIVEHVKVSHKRGQCENIAEVTAWINEELLEDDRMVSTSFIKSNK